MRIDLNNVEEKMFLNIEGKHLLKVVSVDESQVTSNGNAVLKVQLKTREEHIFTEEFVVTDKALWKVKLFTKALKMPNVVDTHLMIDRFVHGMFVYENYTKKDGSQSKKLTCKEWLPSSQTNTLTNEPKVQVMPPITTPNIDISDDEIPF